MFDYLVRAKGGRYVETTAFGCSDEVIYRTNNDIGDGDGALRAAEDAHNHDPKKFIGTLIVERVEQSNNERNRFYIVNFESRPSAVHA